MILKSYDDYKDSESKWLGEIPKHWNVQQLKSVIVNWRNGKWGNDPIENAPDNYVCVRVADFNRTKGLIDDKKLTYRNYKDENISDCLIRPNHILIERSGGGDNQLVGSTVLYRLNYPAVCSNFISILEIDESKVDVDFLQYAFTHLYFLNLNKLAIKQTSGIQNLDLKQYIQNNFALPSKSEQIQVVDFLHKETSRIDTLISKQEQLIQLLEEQRKSIISYAVAKGLNPNTPMKDSGIEWLNEVPEHWKESKIKYICKLISNKTSEKTNVISLENIESWTGKYVASATEFDSDSISFEKDDLLFGKLRPYLAKVYLATNSGQALGDIYVLRANELMTPEYFQYILLSAKFIDYVNSSTNGTKMPRANWEFIGSISIYLPDKNEQLEIVAYIKDKVAKIENSIFKQNQLIARLKEYRSSIISHAVTGKIDVREAL